MAKHELRTGQMFQVLRAAQEVYTYALKDGRIREFSFHLFRKDNFLVMVLKGSGVLRLVLYNSHAKQLLWN